MEEFRKGSEDEVRPEAPKEVTFTQLMTKKKTQPATEETLNKVEHSLETTNSNTNTVQ
jgi:hypothetical protein